MKRQTISFLLLAAAFSTIQAQQNGGISPEMMQQIKQTYQDTPQNKAIRNALAGTDARKLAVNQENLPGIRHLFLRQSRI